MVEKDIRIINYNNSLCV